MSSLRPTFNRRRARQNPLLNFDPILTAAVVVLLIFGTIIIRAFSIANRTNDPFGRLVCTGVIAWFAFQIFENIGMTMGLMPMTGVPLPFLSYGGSSMFANLIGIGLLQNVHARLRG